MLAELITLVQDHHKLFQFGDNPEANSLFNLDRALRTGNIKQVIKARKSFVKAASKLGADQAITDKILQLVDRGLKGALIYFLKERINSVVTTLNQNPNNYEMIKRLPRLGLVCGKRGNGGIPSKNRKPRPDYPQI